jgi:CHAT domain-containing protein/tetratricopeptide (TPR) repeat protein
MICLAVASGLVYGALALAQPAPVGGRQADAPRQELSKADAARAGELHARAVALGREGKYAEAHGPLRELLDLRARALGEDHYATADARRELETLRRVAALPEADRREYAKTYGLADEMNGLVKGHRFADALGPARRILDTYRRLLGPDAYPVAEAAHDCGQILYKAERYADAEAQFREALRIVLKVAGPDHPDAAVVRGDLAQTLEQRTQYAEARRLHEASVADGVRLRGEGHPETAVGYNNLACFLDRQAFFADAERLHRRAAAALRAAEGEDSPKLATSYGNLALNLQHQGRYGEAEEVFREAMRIRRKISGEDHPDTGRVYMNLASNREAQGDVAGAEPLYRKALENFRKGYGENSSQTAQAMANLGVNLDRQARFAEAEPLLRDALAIVLHSPGRQVRDAAAISSNLASCLQGQEKYAEAAARCAEALAVLRDKLGLDHPQVAVALNNVATNLHSQGKFSEAERYLREALALTERRLGAGHPQTATARVNLAVNLHYQGHCDEADRLFREALAAQRRVPGEGHPDTAWTYRNLALCCCARGEHARAAALAADATASFEAARRRVSFAGLDRAGRAADISPLPALAAAAARAGHTKEAWQALEQDLARGLLDDLFARPLSDEDRRREQELLGQLDRLDRQAAARAAGPGEDPGGLAADELRRQRDAARLEFVRFQADVAERYGVAAGQVYDLARIRERLSEQAALVAWLDLPAPGQGTRSDARGDHWACLLRRRGDPVWVRLSGTGPGGAWTEDDSRLAARVRRAFADRPTGASTTWQDLARRLAAQRLDPLREYLKAGPDLPAVRHLIVLPCARMAGVPVEALADEFTVSYAPSGTMLAWLGERKAGRAPPPANLLALGDPAFRPHGAAGAGRKPAAPVAGRSEAFAPLPGTRQELLGIARVFSETRLFMGTQASEQALDRLAASGGLRAFPYLHFATHGVLDDRSPLHSALILAREPGRDPAEAVADVPHGRLTAERILRRWKLDAELVTLSACDTGVGKFSGGEGYLGFSQALFVAGARSLVLSLWQVEDAATALLMARFYENLLGTPDGSVKPMPKARALAEAKRWLRGLGSDEVRELTKDLPQRGTRGRIEPREGGADAKALRCYDHPYYWSGFILVGDPG